MTPAANPQSVCRVYLTTPPALLTGGVSLSAFRETLAAGANVADIACLLIGREPRQAALTQAEIARELIPPAKALGMACLLEDGASHVKACDADGAHLGDANGYEAARRALGRDLILGVSCPVERHAAMTIAENGADYVAFNLLPGADAAAEAEMLALIDWWSDMMTVPSVLFAPMAIAPAALGYGVDFLAPADLWQQQDPVAALAILQQQIDAQQARVRR